MNELSAPLDCEDAAWVSFKTPLSPAELADFSQDIHRLLRINPYLEFVDWRPLSKNSYHLEAINTSTQPANHLKLDIQLETLEDGIRLTYNNGIKDSTRISIEADVDGSRLSIVDSYNAVDTSTREQRLDEVDRSLVKWAEEIQQYLIRWHRWSKLPIWRWYMKYVWQPMKPSARRITYMLLWITLIEVLLISLGAVIFMIEY